MCICIVNNQTNNYEYLRYLCAKELQELVFFSTHVGCGIAGYTSKEITPLFVDAAQFSNVYLPISFWKNLMRGFTEY